MSKSPDEEAPPDEEEAVHQRVRDGCGEDLADGSASAADRMTDHMDKVSKVVMTMCAVDITDVYSPPREVPVATSMGMVNWRRIAMKSYQITS